MSNRHVNREYAIGEPTRGADLIASSHLQQTSSRATSSDSATMYKRRLLFLAVLFCLVACDHAPRPRSNSGASVPENSNANPTPRPAESETRGVFNSRDFRTKAVFELVNQQGVLIQQGSSKLVIESAVVTNKSGLMPGNVEGLEIRFFTKSFTEAELNDVLENEGRETRTRDHAMLVLLLDKQNAIADVNLTYVVPGTTVTMPVAANPDDLKKYFSNYHFDGKRLQLRSKGSYDEKDANQKSMSLAWNVDIDLPVFDLRRR